MTTFDGDGADAFIWSNRPTTNFGSAQAISLKCESAIDDNNRKGYLRFDLTGLPRSVTSVELILTYAGTDETPPASPSRYDVYVLDDALDGAWTEATLTWNNAPGNDTASSCHVDSSSTAFVGSFSFDPSTAAVGTRMSLASRELQFAFQNDSDNRLTVILARETVGPSLESFASREHPTLLPPTLSVTSGAPELPGDCNQDGLLDISDAVCIFRTLYSDEPALFPCGDGSSTDPANLVLLDWQADGRINQADGVASLSYLFRAGPPHALAAAHGEDGTCIPIAGCLGDSGCR